MKRILFIGNDAGRSGAPIVLLHLLRWLREKHPNLVFDVLLRRGGELENEYRRLAEVYVLPDESGASLIGRGIRRLGRGLGRGWRPLATDLAPFRRRYDVVLGNTIVTLEQLQYFKARGLRTVCWAHELEYVISSIFTRERFQELSRAVDYFISASKAVDATLREFGVTAESQVVYEISPKPKEANVDPADLKKELGFPKDSFLIGGGGTVEWRKGTDLFLQIAAVLRTEPNIRFVWVGGTEPPSVDHIRVRHDLKRLGLEKRVVFTGVTDRPEKYLSVIDVFALTSREDPFPLICLEAASLGKPIVCFDQSGGMPEFVESDAGAVVPYGDINSFAAQIIQFERDRKNVKAVGHNAQNKMNSHFAPDTQCEHIERILMRG